MMIDIDMLGTALVPGDFVAYGVRDGNSGALRIGIIKEITKKEKKYRPGEFYYYVRVRGMERNFKGRMILFSRDGFTTTTDNMVKLVYLPTEIANMLENHYAEWLEKVKK